MNCDFLILGGSGMQGIIVAKYLLQKGYDVVLGDIKEAGARSIIEQFPQAVYRHIDLSNRDQTAALIKEVKPSVVINCAEMDWNMNVYRACLETKTHVIDLGSDVPTTKEQLALHEDFAAAGVTAISGCGSTPGINNVLLAYAAGQFDTVESVELGFAWDGSVKQFVVPFSIETLIEEFTVPAEIVENGQWAAKDPLEHVVEKEFAGLGKQSCILVHHSETLTFYNYLQDKGIKHIRFYGGFPKQIFDPTRMFVELGLGSREPVIVDGKSVVPLDVLDAILRILPRPDNYTESEVLWVEVDGIKSGQRQKVVMECRVNTLAGWEDAGSNIDTGIPAGIIAEMVHNGEIEQRGSFAPEQVVPPQSFFERLSPNGMDIFENGQPVTFLAIGSP